MTSHKWMTFFSLSPQHPSRFEFIRSRPWILGLSRECLAEFMSTLVQFSIGLGSNAQAVMGKENFFGNQFAWGLAVMFGIYTAGGVSGAHMNPAVTLAMAVHRKFEWYKVVPFMIAQFFGAFTATALVYCVYYDAISTFDPLDSDGYRTDKSAGIFMTMEGSWLSVRGAILDNMVGTGMLLGGLFALNDSRNVNPVAANLAPLLIGWLITTICLAFALNAGAAINPVRDFPERLFLSMSGWGSGVFSRHTNYFLVPIFFPFIGAQLGALAYDLFITIHHDQPTSLELVDSGVNIEPEKSQNADVTYESSDGPYHSLSSVPIDRVDSNGSINERRIRESSINIHAIGGRQSAELHETTGLVHINEAFLDPSIKASADATFHRNRSKKQHQQQSSDDPITDPTDPAAAAKQPLLPCC